MSRVILVAGAAGAGKTTWARRLAEPSEHGHPGDVVIATDDYLYAERDERPGFAADAVKEALIWLDDEDARGRRVIVEGCEALRAAVRGGFADQVSEVHWVAVRPEREGCAGLTTQQLNYALQLAPLLPRDATFCVVGACHPRQVFHALGGIQRVLAYGVSTRPADHPRDCPECGLPTRALAGECLVCSVL